MKNIQTEVSEEIEGAVSTAQPYELMLWNDDVNTFDFVIESLVNVCEHTLEQAEQCTLLVHYKGKCVVKTGPLKALKQQCTSLLNRGLSAEIISAG